MRLPRLSRRSLFRRSALVLVGFTLLIQLILYIVSFGFNLWPLLLSSTEDLADLMVISATTLEAAPPERRAALRAQLSLRHRLSMTQTTEPLIGQPSLLPYTQLLRIALSKRLGQEVQVVKNGSIYSVEIPADGHKVRFSFPRSRIGTDPLTTFAVNLIITLLLSLAAALVAACKLTCPLRDLSQAATQVGQGHAPQLNVKATVLELDELVGCFNTMAQQVHTLINNRTTLLAGISHDLRSPLARARLSVELARENIGPVALDDIDRYLAQMEILLKEFLEFSKGVYGARTVSTDLCEVLSGLCADFERGDPAVSFLGESVSLHVDQVSLDRVLRNLVNNARRYGGGQPVEIHCATVDRNVVIEVMDRGPGIPPADRARVFEPFVRLESSRNRATGGSGLGLAIVRDICHAEGWRVELLRRYGGGLTVRLTIPVRESGGRSSIPRAAHHPALVDPRPATQSVPAIEGKMGTGPDFKLQKK